MKRLLVLAIVAAGVYYAWTHYRPAPDPAPRARSGTTTPGANAKQRIDNLSGAAPDDH